ncbi:MAG: AAA family ATPase [Brevibacterium sp.]|uniref:AAA family ATPase n=1 Tax=Brevibacterium sandarakinum TaxID=629680 RepID=UPI00264BBA31|nr:ATP-binding protein [Brevibacterium sandarakinum]MDN5587220.1 AAA family ATPase [Brevibacterium sp.]MDN5656732.1 AAA family ATPase [Brevibacterium sandarakinum]
MLLEFRVRNFRSFADTATLDLTSKTLRTLVPRNGQSWIDSTVRTAAIFGPNASGKSTLLDALETLIKSIRRPRTLLFHPHFGHTSGTAERTEYFLSFVADDVRYDYEISAEDWGISYESLKSYPHGTARHLFTRVQDHKSSEMLLSTGSTLKGPTQEVRRITTRTATFLSTAFQYEHLTLAPVARALVHSPHFQSIEVGDQGTTNRLQWVMARLAEGDDGWQELVNSVARAADLGITEVRLDERELPEDLVKKLEALYAAVEDDPEMEVPEEIIASMGRSLVFTHKSADGGEFSLPLNAQSAGTITWMATVLPAIEALTTGGALVVDELDSSLHPSLTASLIEMFKDEDINHLGAQLIFVAHDTALLSNSPSRILEPNEVWFCEKDDDGTSELFSLQEFDTRKGNNEQKRYLAGKFGAVPDVNVTEPFRRGLSLRESVG